VCRYASADFHRAGVVGQQYLEVAHRIGACRCASPDDFNRMDVIHGPEVYRQGMVCRGSARRLPKVGVLSICTTKQVAVCCAIGGVDGVVGRSHRRLPKRDIAGHKVRVTPEHRCDGAISGDVRKGLVPSDKIIPLGGGHNLGRDGVLPIGYLLYRQYRAVMVDKRYRAVRGKLRRGGDISRYVAKV
jgi:hypothetical protein